MKFPVPEIAKSASWALGVLYSKFLHAGGFVCLIWFLTSHQQSFSYVGTGLPGLNQY